MQTRLPHLVLIGILATAGLSVHAESAESTVPKDFKLPAGVSVSVYLPKQFRKLRSVSPSVGTVESGRTLEDIALSAAREFFVTAEIADSDSANLYGLLIALHPQPKVENDQLIYEVKFVVTDPDARTVLSGIKTSATPLNQFGGGDLLESASEDAIKLVMTDVVSNLRPDTAKFPATGSLKSRSMDFLADRDKPRSSGTGFYINALGQVLTAAHVVNECLVVEANQDGKVIPGKVIAKSNLVDLAVIDTGSPVTKFLPLRRGTSFDLGEPVVIVGYPLESILAASPSLTRGNVSSRAGLSGSVGQFQFSAPIQPGSSGGPVVSDSGELLGIAVGTLNAAALARVGTIPQNVNFALDARYAAMFLTKYGIEFKFAEAGAAAAARSRMKPLCRVF